MEDIANRASTLERMRALKMARSTHAYVRGNTIQFYEWLAGSRSAARLPSGPPVWICGDCHLGNLGPVASANGNVDIQIRDLDQTVIGNPAHDLIRLGLSLATAARGSALPGVTTARMMEEMVEGYDHALALGDEDETPEPNVVRTVRRRALGRRWRHLADERLTKVQPRLPLGRKFWALQDNEREELERLFMQDAVRSSILSLNGREVNDRVRLLDAAYWMKGCSSLGKLRYAVLVGIGGSKKTPGEYALIDLKEAVGAIAPASAHAEMPADNAERVVAGAQALAPNLGERMLATCLLGQPIVLRELMPQDLKLEVDQFSRAEATKAARYLAYVVGVAHARQMNRDDRRAWRRTIAHRPLDKIDAPSWLWDSVVDLTASHEAGYLEHCRRYALSDVA
ncbi:DUF2252 family protein [Novosphingobium sp. PS1R-30]|uniref:DUF2252 family protein n=1 Tax=Novosphingobium anseongense TaxID=3133436 RepID=A0ABU8RUF9_9SPHN